MKRAFVAGAVALLMLVAVGSARADHFSRGGCARPTVVVRSCAPVYTYRPYGLHAYPTYGRTHHHHYDNHHHHYRYDHHDHHGHGGIAVGGSGVYFRLGF